MNPDVIIIGGGLAGLSASVKLVKAGATVLLIDKNNHLGGRTYSFIDRRTGTVVDNGQHLLIGAYKNTFEYLEMIGTKDLLFPSNDNSLNFIEEGKSHYNFSIPNFPAPINLLIAILKITPLSWSDKINLFDIGKIIKKWNDNLEKEIKDLSVEEFLNKYGQSYNAKKYFWYPLVISVMNESPNVASALLFAKVLKNTYFSKAENHKIWLPSVGQTELYVEKAIEMIKDHHSKVIMKEKVDNILIENGKVIGVNIKGKLIKSKYVVSAVPNYNFLDLLPAKDRHTDFFVKIREITSSPIISVNLWFDREIFDEQFIGLINTNVHWVFNRNKIVSNNNNRFNYITAVISNARSFLNIDKFQIVQLVIEELKSNFPAIKYANLIYYSVIKERNATFSTTPDIEKIRPVQQTEIQNFYMAGDWTNTGLPATIEGAVTSGFLCADLIMGRI